MKRNMDLAREIMLQLEAQTDALGGVILEIPTFSPEQVSYHVMLLAEGGLITAIDASSMVDIQWIPQRLTWKGHEFLDIAHDESSWKTAVERVMKTTGGLAFSVLAQVLAQQAIKAAGL